MKILMLTSGQPNQIALCRKLSTRFELQGIVISQNVPKKRPKHRVQIFANRLAGRLVGSPLARAWSEMQASYASQFATLPEVPTARVQNINDADTLAFLEKHNPDLVVVSGTNLVGKAIVEFASRRRGIVNLHTGISPYVKGGPNCTNWCLAENDFHLIGNTTIWLDLGIDTGAIIGTEQTALSGAETLSELHWKVMEHAHDLYLRSITAALLHGKSDCVSQSSIAEGRTFYTFQWNALAMARAIANFKLKYRPVAFAEAEFKRKTEALRLFPVRS